MHRPEAGGSATVLPGRTDRKSVRRRSAPLLPTAAGLAVGIAVDNAAAPALMVYAALCFVVAVALSVRGVRHRMAWLIAPAAAFALGGVLHDRCYRRVSPDHIVHYVMGDLTIARVTGTVVSTPKPYSRRDLFFARWMYQTDDTRFLLDTHTLDARPGPVDVSGLVSVKVSGALRGVDVGDEVEVFGKLYRQRSARNPGQFDFAKWQRRHGIRVAMVCQGAELVKVVTPSRDRLRTALAGLRARTRGIFVDPDLATSDDETSLLDTLVLGRRRAVDPRIEELFLRTGTTHYLAVSGAHVGMIAWFVWYLGRRIGGTRRRAALFVMVTIVLYACIVDPRPPIFRATVVGLVYCIAILLRRSASAANSIALAMILLLCIRPTMLFEPGFQMSFAGVLAICYLYRPLLSLLIRDLGVPPDASDTGAFSLSSELHPLLRVCRAPCAWVAVGTAACMVSTPIAAVHFGRIAPLGCVFSIAVFPFFGLTILSGFAAMVLGLVAPGSLALTAPIARLAASWLLWWVELLERISPRFYGWGAVLFVLVYIAVVLLLVARIQVGNRSLWRIVQFRLSKSSFPNDRISRPRFVGLMVITSAVVILTALSLGTPAPQEPLRVTHLAVGRGTAAVIEFPNGQVWLYDCGTNGNFDPGASIIAPFCHARGIDRIDRVIISHPNLDHFNGLLSVIDALPTGPVGINPHFESLSKPRGPAKALLAELRRRGHRIEIVRSSDGAVMVGGVRVEILWPMDEPGTATTPNDSSTVIRLSYQNRSILMCGDIEEDAMAALIGRVDVRADVLVLPHHGSRESNTAAFVSAVDPHLCVRSSNQRSRDTSESLLNTADDGAVTITVGDQGVTVRGYVPRDAPRSSTIRRGE